MEEFVFLYPDIRPSDIDWIENFVSNLDCICSCYDSNKEGRYSSTTYLEEKYIHQGVTHAVLDRNIMSSLTKAASNGRVTTEDEREAFALLCFLRIAEIELEPGIGLAEYSDSYFNPNPQEELHLLRKVDNIPNDNLLHLAKGKTTKVDIAGSSYNRDTRVRNKIKTGHDIHQWTLHYGYVLKVFILHHEHLSPLEFAKKFYHWMWKDYAIGALAFPFLGTFLSPKFGGIIKGINSSNTKKALKGMRNAAWDLTLVHYWLRHIIERLPSEPLRVLCTRDNALKFLTENVANVDGQTTRYDSFKRIWSDCLNPKEVREILQFYQELESRSNDTNREVHKYRMNKHHFDDYVLELEQAVLDSIKKRSQESSDSAQT